MASLTILKLHISRQTVIILRHIEHMMIVYITVHTPCAPAIAFTAAFIRLAAYVQENRFDQYGAAANKIVMHSTLRNGAAES